MSHDRARVGGELKEFYSRPLLTIIFRLLLLSPLSIELAISHPSLLFHTVSSVSFYSPPSVKPVRSM